MKQRDIYLFAAMIIVIFSCSVIPNTRVATKNTIMNNLSYTNSLEESHTLNSLSINEITKTITPTRIPIMSNTSTSTIHPNILTKLLSGRYIIYTKEEAGNKYYLYAVSENGKEEGKIMEGGTENRSYLSPNQRYIAISVPYHINIFDLDKMQIFELPIPSDCNSTIFDLAWSPDNNELAITCFMSIMIVSIQDGIKIGEIFHIIDASAQDYPLTPIWSPNGKWMAYFVQSEDLPIGIQGPFVTDTSCIKNKEECEKVTKLIVNAYHQLIAWNPSNLLAVLDSHGRRIQLYNVESSSLIQTIIIPDSIGGVISFSWSNDNEWIALGCSNGIFIMSIMTGETRKLSDNSDTVNFWFIVP